MKMLFSYMDSDNLQPERYMPMDFAASGGQVPEFFSPGLVPCQHVEPVLNDSTLPVPDWDKSFGEDRRAGQAQSRMPMDFTVPDDQVPEFFSSGLVPYQHVEPELDDSMLPEPDWARAFRGDLKLTDAKKGLRSQVANRNIAEIANAILSRYEIISVADQLAIYNPPCWRIMGRDDMHRFVAEAVAGLFPQDKDYLDSRQYDQIIFHLRHNHKIDRLQTVPSPDPQYLCCRDGMYDWRSQTCRPHDSSFMRFSCLDIDAGSIENCDGTHWEMFLDNLTGGNPALRQRVLEMIGVILSGYPTKSFFFLQGEGGTGKSQLVNFLRDVLGTSACVALNDISQLGEKWTPGSLFGKLLCVCGDMPDAPLNSKTIGAIKQLTGDDLIRGEFKYKNAFMFENTAKLLFVSNYPLRIPNPGRERALLDRLVDIPCQNAVEKQMQIPDLHKLLYEERGCIAYQAMEALAILEARNGVFTPLPEEFVSPVMHVSDKEYFIREFIKENFILEEGASCVVNEVFRMFRTHYPEVEICVEQFSKVLRRIYPEIKKDRVNCARKFIGLRLADSADPS